MLKKLHVKNFRTHEDLTMEFSPGVNVIWGLPGSGKTNILRAIDWIVTNKPKFERVHSHFAKDGKTSVTLVLDNGTAELSKTSKTNKFVFNNEKSFSFTGATVPEPIAQLLNMNEINISKQLDPHFLITSTPGDVGKTINRITKIEKIDSWISKLTTLSNKTKWKVEEQESDCSIIEKDIQQYDGIEDLEKEIRKYDKLSEQFLELMDKIQFLQVSKERMEILKERIDKLESLKLESHIKELNHLVNQCKIDHVEYLHISQKREDYSFILRKKNLYQSIIDPINIEGLDELIKELHSKYKLYVTLNFVKKLNQTIFTKKERLKVAKAEYLKTIEELGICPVCQNQISLEYIHNLETSL